MANRTSGLFVQNGRVAGELLIASSFCGFLPISPAANLDVDHGDRDFQREAAGEAMRRLSGVTGRSNELSPGPAPTVGDIEKSGSRRPWSERRNSHRLEVG
jgi:hypothetical protein